MGFVVLFTFYQPKELNVEVTGKGKISFLRFTYNIYSFDEWSVSDRLNIVYFFETFNQEAFKIKIILILESNSSAPREQKTYTTAELWKIP
jgi:hypothetical protein